MKSRELPYVRDMFDHIAPRYDFLNRLLSLRRDVFWRHVLVKGLRLAPGARVLDVACGTGDVALEVVRQAGKGVFVAAADFAPQMLRLARPKVREQAAGDRIGLLAADAFNLPFRRGLFDAVTIAFGIRNIQDKAMVLERFYQVLKPGGRLAVLELASPDSGVLKSAFLFYFHRVLPLVGRLFSKHGFAYSYLPASVAMFPPAPDFAALMHAAGFRKVSYRKMTMGVAVLFTGDKPRVL
jgi:demethylmenaquinone methyltransferase/2-methoxy-6-polyprenyl-1,4-benzoquinol methylase